MLVLTHKFRPRANECVCLCVSLSPGPQTPPRPSLRTETMTLSHPSSSASEPGESGLSLALEAHLSAWEVWWLGWSYPPEGGWVSGLPQPRVCGEAGLPQNGEAQGLGLVCT